MTATPPPNFTLVACGGSSTPNSDGTSATESVNVPSGGAGVGIFYVTAISTTPVTTPTDHADDATSQPTTSPSQTTPTTHRDDARDGTADHGPLDARLHRCAGRQGVDVRHRGVDPRERLDSHVARLRLRRPKHAASKQK